jgi:hypothetical protein
MLFYDDTPLCNKQTACSCVHHRDSYADASNISNINRQLLLSLIQVPTNTKPTSLHTIFQQYKFLKAYIAIQPITTHKMCIRTTYITHCTQCGTQFEERISTTFCDKAEGQLGKCGKIDDIVSDREILCARCRYENSKK